MGLRAHPSDSYTPSVPSLTPHVRLGIQLPEVERVVRWPEYLAMARAAEDLGFDSLWVGDHLLYRNDGRPERGPQEAWTLLAAIAAVTRRVTIGPLVACTAFHPPGVLAKMACTIDDISNGRLVLGLGAGWNESEFTAFGIPFDHRAGRFEESFAAVAALTAGERVTMRGTYNELADAVVLPAPTRPVSLMIGSTGTRVLRAALPHVDWWNTWYDWYGNSADGFARLDAEISAQLESVGRSPDAVRRSACVLVEVDPLSTERTSTESAPAVPLSRLSEHLQAMAEAGAHEVILVANPIDLTSLSAIAAELSGRDQTSAGR